MEDALAHFQGIIAMDNSIFVLILVVMEDALAQRVFPIQGGSFRVLILVVMEDALALMLANGQ